VAAAPVPEIESDRVACEKTSHDVRNGSKPGAQQKMKVIGYQGPCKTAGLAGRHDTAQSLQKILAVGVVPENLPPLDASYDDVMQGTRCI
jgi:hypothetical protein